MIIEGEARPDYILWKTSVSFGKSMKSSPLRPTIFRKLDTLEDPQQKRIHYGIELPY
jgi:hypothetical protein